MRKVKKFPRDLQSLTFDILNMMIFWTLIHSWKSRCFGYHEFSNTLYMIPTKWMDYDITKGGISTVGNIINKYKKNKVQVKVYNWESSEYILFYVSIVAMKLNIVQQCSRKTLRLSGNRLYSESYKPPSWHCKTHINLIRWLVGVY